MCLHDFLPSCASNPLHPPPHTAPEKLLNSAKTEASKQSLSCEKLACPTRHGVVTSLVWQVAEPVRSRLLQTAATGPRVCLCNHSFDKRCTDPSTRPRLTRTRPTRAESFDRQTHISDPLSWTSLSDAIKAGVVPRASAFSGSARAERRARQILRCLAVLRQMPS